MSKCKPPSPVGESNDEAMDFSASNPSSVDSNNGENMHAILSRTERQLEFDP